MINLHSLIRNSYQPLPILQILVKQLRLIPSFQIDLIISFNLNFFIMLMNSTVHNQQSHSDSKSISTVSSIYKTIETSF